MGHGRGHESKNLVDIFNGCPLWEIAPQSVANYGLLADFPDVAMFDFTSMFQVGTKMIMAKVQCMFLISGST